MRHFIRHPADIPIEVHSSAASAGRAHTFNVSLGGLSFVSETEFAPGVIVGVRIPHIRPPFETQARVAWCRARDRGFDLGVEFLSPDDAFRGRMVEQVCHIEKYKKEVLQTEGRQLSPEQAAFEWIGKYAADFPDLGASEPH